MAYVDGFVTPVPKKNLAAYLRMSRKAGKIWKEYGALEYREAAGDDLNMTFCTTFPKMMKLKKGETVFFAWIVYKSKKHRDKVNAEVMKDPRLKPPKDMPFDCRRMVYGGFDVAVDF